MHPAAALEGNGTIAVQLQLVFPVIALRECAGREQEHWVKESSFCLVGRHRFSGLAASGCFVIANFRFSTL
jgi:hypothetical protein